MNVLKSIAFGSALLVAGFTASAPAQADSFGVYAGSGGVSIHLSNFGGGGRWRGDDDDHRH